MQEDAIFTCPHCWQQNSILLDLSAGGQEFVYDCEVCCNPLNIAYAVDEGHISELDVTPLGQ